MGASPVSGPIQFIDDQQGWMVDGDGQILATTDGGHTWNVQLSGPTTTKAIAFLDAQHGWGVFEGGLIQTADGGGHWVTWSNQALSYVQFLTEKVGWGVGAADEGTPGLLMETEDGGVTWTRRTLDVNSVCFVTERFGWAAGPHEAGIALFWTADGGQNWTELPIPLPGGDYTGWSATVRCAGDTAWVLGQGDGGAGHVAYALFHMVTGESEVEPVLQDAYTHPLGQDKGTPEASNPYPGPLAVPDAQSARFITWCPPCGGELPFVSLERTQDGGATWTDPTVVDSNQPAEPLGISFTDQDHGWILLRDLETGATAVLRTSDGGQTWDQP